MKFFNSIDFYGVAGVPSIFAGLRDIYFPDFLSISTNPVSKMGAALEVATGVIILGYAFSQFVKAHNANRTTFA